MRQAPRQRRGAPGDVEDLEKETADLGSLTIDRGGEIPIGVQLGWALRSRICARQLAPGQRLPGVREMAETAGVNANTVRSVYQRLEREGLIESRHGTGTFVSGAAPARPDAGELAASVARQARDRGMDPREVAAALYVVPQTAEQEREAVGGKREAVGGKRKAADGTERRRELRAQITALEHALAEIETSNPGLLGPPPDASRMAGPRLLSAKELEQVRARLVRRLADAQLALDAREGVGGAGDPAREAQPAVQPPVPTGRPARANTLATVKLATP